jgi:hypothetical protein
VTITADFIRKAGMEGLHNLYFSRNIINLLFGTKPFLRSVCSVSKLFSFMDLDGSLPDSPNINSAM